MHAYVDHEGTSPFIVEVQKVRQRTPGVTVTMQRVKNVGYDDDDLYDDQDDEYDQDDGTTYSAEDKEHFASLTPVIRAELEEVGVQASDKAIEDALWHYYWDVGKSVSYLKSSGTPRPQQQSTEKTAKAKTKSKFDEAAERSAAKAGESSDLFLCPGIFVESNIGNVYSCMWRGGQPSLCVLKSSY